MCETLQKKVEGAFGRLFEKWGSLLARKGWLVALITLLVFLPLVAGFLARRQFEEQQKAWSPVNNRAINDEEIVFGLPLYDIQQAQFIYTAKNNENVITIAHFQHIVNFHTHILDYSNSNLRNSNCVKSGTRCLYSGHIVQYFEDANGQVTFPGAITTDAQLLTTVNQANNAALGLSIAVGDIFGGTTPSTISLNSGTSTYNIQEAKAIKFTYLIFDEQPISDYVRQAISSFKSTHNLDGVIDIDIWTFVLFDGAINSGIFGDIIIINISIVLLVTYSVIVLGTCHPVKIRIIAPLIGIGCTMLSFGVAYGLCSAMQLKVTSIHNLLPFLLLGIGADDMYVITAVADQVNPKMTSKRKMAKTLRLAGVSIMITSITDFVAFMVSGLSALPALKSFSIFAGIGILLDFVFEITVFSAYLACDMRRQSRNKAECCGACCCKPTSCFFCCGRLTPKSELKDPDSPNVQNQEKGNSSKVNLKLNVRDMSSGGLNGKDQELGNNELASPSNGMLPTPNGNSNGNGIHLESENNVKSSSQMMNYGHPEGDVDPNLDDDTLYVRDSFIQTCLSKYFARFITHSTVQIIVIIFFVLLTAFACFGITQVETNFELDFFVNSDHFLQGFIKARDANFPNNGNGCRMYTTSDVDPLTEDNQTKYLKIVNILSGTETCQNCKENWVINGSVNSWYSAFLTWIDGGACNAVCGGSCKNGNVVAAAHVKQCLYNFLQANQGKGYKDIYIVTTDSGTTVSSVQATATQFTIKKPVGSEEAVRMMDDLRGILVDEGLSQGAFVWAQVFLTWEQYKDFPRELTVSLVLALVAIFLIVLIFSGSFCASGLIFFNMGLIDLNLLALIWYWGLELNFITMINLILAIGLAVDYSAHIAHAYNCSEAPEDEPSNIKRRKARVRLAFRKIGSSVFHGAFSTFLAIVTISASSSYIFRAFFKQWFAIILFGMLHGFFLLPVLLSLIGPLPSKKKQPQQPAQSSS